MGDNSIYPPVPSLGDDFLSRPGNFNPAKRTYTISYNGTKMKIILERENGQYRGIYSEIEIEDGTIYVGNFTPENKQLGISGFMIHLDGRNGISISNPFREDAEKMRGYVENVSSNGFKDSIRELAENPRSRIRKKLSPELALFLGLDL